MTDEEIGRKWCIAAGQKPDFCRELHDMTRKWRWVYGNTKYRLCEELPQPLYPAVGAYDTEAEAYAAVGKSLREVWDFADHSRQEVNRCV